MLDFVQSKACLVGAGLLLMALGAADGVFASPGGEVVPGDKGLQSSGASPVVASNRCWLEVRLDPVRHRLDANAQVILPGIGASQTVVFSLNHQLTVTSVRVGNKPVAFSRGALDKEDRPLLVRLDAAQGRELFELAIEYHGTIAPPGPEDPDWMGALVLRTNEIRMTEQSRWYPVASGPRTRVEASITLPSEMTLVWPGELSRVRADAKQTTWLTTNTPPIVPALIAGTYTTRSRYREACPIDVLVFPETEGDAEPILNESAEILRFLESEFGAYPFRRFSVCQMRVLNSRYSYNFACPGAVVLPTEIVQMTRRADRKAFWTRKLAHEIAHQWWGTSVELSRQPWPIHESLAEFSAVLCLQRSEPDQPWQELLAAEAEPVRLMSFLARRGQSPSEREYRQCLGYQKGPWVLGMLRETAGQDAFARALRSFFARKAFQTASREEFENCFEAVPGVPPATFFHQWMDQPVLPRLTAELLSSNAPDGLLRLRIGQAEPAFSLAAEIRLATADGATNLQCLVTRAQQEIEVPIRGRLLGLEVDPNSKLLLEMEPGSMSLCKTLARLEAGCKGLDAACQAKAWPTADTHARALRDGCRKLLQALDWEKQQEALRSNGRLNARTEFAFVQAAELKTAIASVVPQADQEARLRRCLYQLERSSDAIHHAIRAQQPVTVPDEVAKVQSSWRETAATLR